MKIRPLYVIAAEIIADFKKENRVAKEKYEASELLPKKKCKYPINWSQKYAPALAYVQPMLSLDKITEDYGMDSAQSVVLYALCNLQTWRGEKAKAIKKELKAMTK